MVDELDKLAARRVVIVVEEPYMDGTGSWKVMVDFDDEQISPGMAKGILNDGIDHLNFTHDMSIPEEDGEEDK